MHTIKSRENNLHRKARKQLGVQTAEILGVVLGENRGRVEQWNFKYRLLWRNLFNTIGVGIICQNTAVWSLLRPGNFT